jgi:N-acyl-D-aspartate/D-glutamate deacylase
MTGKVADLLGLRDRGTLAEGAFADIVVFDPDTIGCEPATLVHDLPGGAPRMTAASTGIARVYVNGVETVVDGAAIGTRPGTVLRSGRDTDTVTVH